jgi:hypothetical protein
LVQFLFQGVKISSLYFFFSFGKFFFLVLAVVRY